MTFPADINLRIFCYRITVHRLVSFSFEVYREKKAKMLVK